MNFAIASGARNCPKTFRKLKANLNTSQSSKFFFNFFISWKCSLGPTPCRHEHLPHLLQNKLVFARRDPETIEKLIQRKNYRK